MAELTIELVREWLTENKEADEVKTFFQDITPTAPEITADVVRPFLETADGKALIQPLTDKRVNDAIKTFREGHFERDVKAATAAEVLKLNPQETPEQTQIRELREEMEKEKGLRERDNLRRQIVERAAKDGIPSWWVEDFSGNTIEEAQVFMGKVKTEYEQIATKAKNELLAGGFKPGSGTGQKEDKPDISKLSMEDMIKLDEEGKLDGMLAG